jgi:hypothetical protein
VRTRLNAVLWTGAMLSLCNAGLARAQTTDGYVPAPTPHWTVDSGQTVGADSNVLRGQVGWPGFVGDFIHGIDSQDDIGGRVSLNYAVEGITAGGGYSAFEFKIQLTLRRMFLDNGKIKVAGTFDPGYLLWTKSGFSRSGLTLPIGVQVGIPINQLMTANASFDIPFWFTFGDFSQFHIPLLFGVGFEYLLQPNLALTAKLKMGPDIGTGDFSSTNFALYALFGVAYKM